MTYDHLRRLETQYANFLKRMPYFESSKVITNEKGKWVIGIHYRQGMSSAVKKEIATELGDIPLKFIMLP